MNELEVSDVVVSSVTTKKKHYKLSEDDRSCIRFRTSRMNTRKLITITELVKVTDRCYVIQDWLVEIISPRSCSRVRMI